MKVIPQLPLLGAMQAVYISAMSIMLSVSALTAAAIEGQVGKSTTPFVILAIGIAISAYSAPKFITKIGYKWLFFCASFICLVAGLIGVWAVNQLSLGILLLGSFAFGLFQGIANYYRFAAVEVGTTAQHKQSGVYFVLAGGIVAAVVGPQLIRSAATGNLGLATSPYWIICALGFCGMLLTAFVFIPIKEPVSQSNAQHEANQAVNWGAYLIGCLGTFLGYLAMTIVMTAGPLALTALHGHASGVPTMMQLHFLGMFSPMVILPWLARYFAPHQVIILGSIIGIAGVAWAIVDQRHIAMLASMVGIGLAWALTYGAGSVSLAMATQSTKGKLLRGVGELFPALGLAIGALFAGPAIQHFGWSGINSIALLSLAIIILGVLVIKMKTRNQN